MLYDADRILEMDFLRDLNKNFAVITLAVSVSLWPKADIRITKNRVRLGAGLGKSGRQ